MSDLASEYQQYQDASGEEGELDVEEGEYDMGLGGHPKSTPLGERSTAPLFFLGGGMSRALPSPPTPSLHELRTSPSSCLKKQILFVSAGQVWESSPIRSCTAARGDCIGGLRQGGPRVAQRSFYELLESVDSDRFDGTLAMAFSSQPFGKTLEVLVSVAEPFLFAA